MCSSNEQKAKKLILFRNFATFFSDMKSIMQLIELAFKIREAVERGEAKRFFFIFRFAAPNRDKKVFDSKIK